MTSLYVPNLSVMSQQEKQALEKATQKQVDKVDVVQTETVSDLPEVLFPEMTEQKELTEQKVSYPVDMYGQEIWTNEYINYPVRQGSDIYMRTAKVIRIRDRNDYLGVPKVVLDVAVAITPNRIRRVTVSCPHRATILPKEYIESDKHYSILIDL